MTAKRRMYGCRTPGGVEAGATAPSSPKGSALLREVGNESAVQCFQLFFFAND